MSDVGSLIDQFQYRSVKPLLGGNVPTWVPEEDQERLAAYTKYDELYFSHQEALQLIRRGTDLQPIYVPNPRTIVDATSHFLLKGLTLEVESEEFYKKNLAPFLKREKFFSRFAVAKHSGVSRGDFVMHLTADPDEEEGARLSLTTVDPSSYFPINDPDDLDKRIGAVLAEQFVDEDKKTRVKKLTYMIERVGSKRRVSRHEAVYELDNKLWGSEPKLYKELLPLELLPETITALPVYHFKNWDWQGQPYGSSELRGFERLLAAVNQTVTDGEITLALEGLGVYATDSGAPTDDSGNSKDWEIAPASVMEVAAGAYFRRVEGVHSMSPVIEFAEYMDKKLMEGSSTFLAGAVDVQVAQSGIALAIRFLPTQAKLEERDLAGIDTLANLFHDWQFWSDEYEGTNLGGKTEIVPTLGDKLPMDRGTEVTELNNMLDRDVISKAFYRKRMERMGYKFPANIEDDIISEKQKMAEIVTQQNEAKGLGPDGKPLDGGDPKNPNAPTLPQKNGSNNKNKVNESKGTEASQTAARQAKNNA